MLTTTELAARYPVANTNSAEAWTRLLDKWRSLNLLVEGSHWRIRRNGRCRRPPREYDTCRVLRLLMTSDNTFAGSVRVEHREAIKAVLSSGKEMVGV